MAEQFVQFLKTLPPIYTTLIFMAVVIGVAGFLLRRIIKPSIRYLKCQTALQIGSWILVLLLAAADMFAMLNLFKSLELGPKERWVYAFTFAFFLEGQPYYMSMALSDLIDRNLVRKEKKIIPIITLTFSIIALAGAVWLSMLLRQYWIEINGGLDDFLTGDYASTTTGNNMEYLGQLFLYWSPLLTSGLAFVASWYALRKDRLQEQAFLVRKLYREYLQCERSFQENYQAYEEACATLWSTLADPNLEPMPLNQADFRQECFIRIREKLVHNCMINYIPHMSEYNARIESELAKYILEVSRHTTIPNVINQISVEDIIRIYESRMSKKADKWDYDLAGPEMEAALLDTLNNAIVVAQFNSITDSCHLEKEW